LYPRHFLFLLCGAFFSSSKLSQGFFPLIRWLGSRVRTVLFLRRFQGRVTLLIQCARFSRRRPSTLQSFFLLQLCTAFDNFWILLHFHADLLFKLLCGYLRQVHQQDAQLICVSTRTVIWFATQPAAIQAGTNDFWVTSMLLWRMLSSCRRVGHGYGCCSPLFARYLCVCVRVF